MARLKLKEVIMERYNKFYESLKCILTNEEKQELGEKLALAVNRIRESQDELKTKIIRFQ